MSDLEKITASAVIPYPVAPRWQCVRILVPPTSIVGNSA